MLDRNTNFEFLDRVREYLDDDTIITALIKSLDSDTVNDSFEYICRCYEIPYKDITDPDSYDDDDEDDDE